VPVAHRCCHSHQLCQLQHTCCRLAILNVQRAVQYCTQQSVGAISPPGHMLNTGTHQLPQPSPTSMPLLTPNVPWPVMQRKHSAGPLHSTSGGPSPRAHDRPAGYQTHLASSNHYLILLTSHPRQLGQSSQAPPVTSCPQHSGQQHEQQRSHSHLTPPAAYSAAASPHHHCPQTAHHLHDPAPPAPPPPPRCQRPAGHRPPPHRCCCHHCQR
jgi:hypothetical protein